MLSQKKMVFDIYTVLDQLSLIQEKEKISAVSINQYLNGIRSFLAYYDVYVIPAKFKSTTSQSVQ
jgi:ABC-type uncharacterized transport system ATPase subunit